jgi:hypothetical protein
MDLSEHKARSLHEIEVDITGLVKLQVNGTDVAIPFLQGPPGVGKTALLSHWANKHNFNLFSSHFALHPIEEIGGIPQFKNIEINGQTHLGTVWSFPDLLTSLWQLDQSKLTIFFLDDFHLCSIDHLNLGFEMFTKRALRGYNLPPNVAFVLAGNTSSKAGTKVGNSAIINIYPVTMDFNYWKTQYAFPNKINYKIISFLSNENYRKYVQMDEQTNKPWGSFRSWTRFSNLLNPLETALSNNIPYSDLLYRAAGHVGDEAASAFTSYYKLYLETEMDKVFDKKKAISVPSDMSGQYIYMLSACGEFFNRYSSKSDAYQILGEIMVKIADKSMSISTVGAKEIAENGNRSIYEKMKKTLTSISPQMAERLTREINLL